MLLLLILNPAYSMDWSYRTFQSLDETESSQWQSINPSRPIVKREYQGFIEYKTSFRADSNTDKTGIYLGKIGDVDKVYVNNILIGQTGDFPPNYSYRMDIERQYFIPETVLRKNDENELKVIVYVKFLVNKGLDVRNVQIGDNSNLHHKKYVAELTENFSKIVIPLLCLILAAISFPTLAPRVLWGDQILISLIGVSSFILGLCRSRICYHFFEMLPVYKITLISSVITIWLVSIYSIGTRNKIQKRLNYLATLAAFSLVVLISIQNDLLETASVGKLWFHVAPIFTLTSIYCVFQKRAKNIPLKLGLIILFLTNLNDNLNDLRIIFTFPMLQIGLGSFITLLILNQTIRLKKSWESFFKKEISLESDVKLGRQSLQLAHDIRSPLEALKSTKESLSLIPESERSLILMAISRIEGIAHNLLKMRKEERVTSTLLAHINSNIDWVIQEKKLQYRSYPDLFLKFENGVHNYQLFTSMGSTQFKRVACNLISNAAEAMGHTGVVTINAVEIENEIQIEISDTGPGFDEKLKDHLFENGFTTKSNGNGLGLYNAKKEVEDLGGRIIVSNNNGAIVRLTLPKASPPSNFPMEINLNGITKIIVLDDDESIHNLWSKRLSKYKIELEHCYSAQALLKKYAQLPQNHLLLSDYEILGEEISGIVSISRLNAVKNSILVTARADEYEINNRCSELNLKLLPKNLALFIPIIDTSSKKVVLIDDDELVHMSWKREGKKSNIEVSTYYTVQSFLDNFHQYERATKIFIDSNLSGNIKGEIESEKIKSLGFDDLFLATGYSKDHIDKPAWIKDVVGKSPTHLFT
ncbi:MAG: HAMP domain-containing histidine kinase [Bacteriovoracaceae bacterium]|nr:HAMP domain-containing histidine kinase [Bacteriovoracaceae bacterium]